MIARVRGPSPPLTPNRMRVRSYEYENFPGSVDCDSSGNSTAGASTQTGTVGPLSCVNNAPLLGTASIKVFSSQAANVVAPETIQLCGAAGCRPASIASPVAAGVTPVVYVYAWNGSVTTRTDPGTGCRTEDPAMLFIIPTGVCAPLAGETGGELVSVRATATATGGFTVASYRGVVDCGGEVSYLQNGTLGATCYQSMPAAGGDGEGFAREAFGGLAERLVTPATVIQCSAVGCRNASAEASRSGTDSIYIYAYQGNETCGAAAGRPSMLYTLNAGVCVPTVRCLSFLPRSSSPSPGFVSSFDSRRSSFVARLPWPRRCGAAPLRVSPHVCRFVSFVACPLRTLLIVVWCAGGLPPDAGGVHHHHHHRDGDLHVQELRRGGGLQWTANLQHQWDPRRSVHP